MLMATYTTSFKTVPISTLSNRKSVNPSGWGWMQYGCEPISEQLSSMNVYKARSTVVRGSLFTKEDILTLILEFQK